MHPNKYIEFAQRVLTLESTALSKMTNRLDEQFTNAVDLILKTNGRVVVCGMGKSGHIGNKIVATLVSTGTPSLFMHPAEAFHGDLGMVTESDVLLLISNSGETDELAKLLPYFISNNIPVISLTGSPNSTIAKASLYHINVAVDEEACPYRLAPTSSTTAALAMGDALAITLMQARNFKPADFARYHPGGALGRKLLGRVRDFAIKIDPVESHASFSEIIEKMTTSRLGILPVSNNDGLVGVVTDGDIRRFIKSLNGDFIVLSSISAGDIMTGSPKVVGFNEFCSTADSLMAEAGINSLVAEFEGGYYIYNNLNR